MRKVVYICSPYSGDETVRAANVFMANHYCRFATEQGAIPVAPHLWFPGFLDDRNEEERIKGLGMACELMTKCDEVWVFCDKFTGGMCGEISCAELAGMTVRYFSTECREVER